MTPSPLPTPDRHLWQIRWVRDLGLLAAVVAVLWVAYTVRAITVPALIGLALAYVFNPLVTWAHHRWRVPRWAGTLVILLSVLLLAAGLVAYVGPRLADQAGQLAGNLPRYLRSGIDRAAPYLDRAGRPSADPPHQAPPSDPAGPDSLPPSAPASQPETQPATAPSLTALAAEQVRQLDWSAVAGKVLDSARLGVSYLLTAVGLVVYLLIAVIVILFTFFVFSWRFEAVIAWFDQFIPDPRRERALHILGRMDRAVSAFIRGRLIQSSLLAFNLTIGWYFAGVPYFLLLGVLTGLLNLVPYLSFLGLPTAVLLTWLSGVSGGAPFSWGLVLWPAVAYLIPQQLDNWVIEPLVQGKATELSPVTVLLAVLIGGSLLGLLGVMLAIPTTACLRILAQELIWPRLRAWARSGAVGKSP